MSLNVEEFFEPCLRRLKRWQGTSGGGSIDDFARQYPDVLEAAFVMRHGPSPATPDACGNQSARQWGNAIAAVRELILRAAADVVLLQEHALTRSAVVPRGYRLAVVADTGEPGWKDVRLANAVLVREGLDVLGSFAIGIGQGAPVPRSAACALVRGLGGQAPRRSGFSFCACSVHLSGGRFDDQAWESITSVRAAQLRTVVDAASGMQVPGAAGPAEPEAAAAWQAPLILGGDFNAQLSPQVARDTLESHPVFARARAEGRDADFLEYMSNGHRFLHDRGFRAAYYPAAPAADSFGEFVRGAPRVNATSVFGGVVDWIYLPASIASARRPSAVSIIDAIGTGVSDHQAVRASLHMPCAPLVGGEPEPSSSQVSFYEGLGTSVPTMVAHWVLYPIQVRQTREVAGSGAAHHEAGMRSKLLATFRSVLFHDQPGRVMSTFAVGFSTFTFWFTFYFVSGHVIGGTVCASVVNVIVTTPFWLLIVRMQVDTSPTPRSWIDHGYQVWLEDGVLGFFTGVVPNLIMIMYPLLQSQIYKRLVDSLVWAFHFESDVDMHSSVISIAPILGALATLASTLITYPMQYGRLRWQSRLPFFPPRMNKDVVSIVVAIYAGLRWKLANSMLTAAFIFAFKEQFFAWVLDM